MLHIVELSDSDSTVSTLLECDIKPGALIQRYSVQWFQISPMYNESIGSMFNLSLSVNSSSDGNIYQCEVTVDHDGNYSATYIGRRFILGIRGYNYNFVCIIATSIILQFFSVNQKPPGRPKSIVGIIAAGILVGLIAVLCLVCLFPIIIKRKMRAILRPANILSPMNGIVSIWYIII